MMLLNQTLAAALANQLSPVYQLRRARDVFGPQNVSIQAALTYVGGGTSIDVYVQTSFDGGANWTDVANVHLTTATAVRQYNLSSLTPVTTVYTPTDAALTANTSKDGLIGSLWRAKWTSVGTYTGATIMRVDIGGGLFVPQA